MAPPATLTDAARALISAFNVPGSDYVPLLKKMEHDVVLQRVLFSDLVSGIGNVHGYLTYHMFDRKPSLVNSGATSPPYTGALGQLPLSTNEANATKGQVTGSGDYLDDNQAGGTQTRTAISFTLNFVRKNTNEEWSLISSSVTLI